MPRTLVYLVQIILSIFLTALIMLQGKGMGLGSAFGGKIGNFSTKRGVEKAVFNFTIVVAVAFFISSVVLLILG